MIALAVAGLAVVVCAPTLLIGILALGVQGLAMALLYLLFGAPDLSFTQFMVETLSVVMFALVMVAAAARSACRAATVRGLLRDGVVALLCGGGVAAVLLAILARPFDNRLSDFFAAQCRARSRMAATSSTSSSSTSAASIRLARYRSSWRRVSPFCSAVATRRRPARRRLPSCAVRRPRAAGRQGAPP